MPTSEFYPIIRRAVARLDDNSPEARLKLYDHARSTLTAQLRAGGATDDELHAETSLLEAAIQKVESGFPKRTPHLLEPSPFLRGLALVSFLGVIVRILFRIMQDQSLLPKAFQSTSTIIVNLMLLVSWISVFWLGRRLQKQQQNLNMEAASGLLLEESFMLYLRPFATSGALAVPCLLPRFLDRWLFGRFWDLELALSLCNSEGRHLVAVGHTKTSFGAAKLRTSDDKWQTLVQRLAAKAHIIAIVPFARPGTLWELRLAFGQDHVLRKTVLIMPPTHWTMAFLRVLMPWRLTNSSSWRAAQLALGKDGISLPNYRRVGGLLIGDGSKTVLFETRNFHPEYLKRFFDVVAAGGRRQVPASKIQESLVKLAAQYPRRRPLVDWLLFFAPRPFLRTGLAASIPLILALSLRTLLFQPMSTSSGSMVPTLLVGDYLFVSKYSYGYTHYSLPFSPRLFSGRILAHPVDRGDVVVFRLPKDDTTDYIKRVVGLPGDRIQMLDGVLNINGVPVKRERIDDYVTDEDGGMQHVRQYRETLPSGVSYATLDLTDNGFYDNTPVYTVPPDHYFMMGDNRDNSTDSRVLSAVGYVPYENIVGKVQIIFFSIEDGTARWSRLFSSVE